LPLSKAPLDKFCQCGLDGEGNPRDERILTFALLAVLNALWTLFSWFGLMVLLAFIFLGAFITDHWQDLLLVFMFLGFLVLGAFGFAVAAFLLKDNAFKEGMGDFLVWLQWVILPERLRSADLKRKIKELGVKYATDKG